jgi:hypothetical protein
MKLFVLPDSELYTNLEARPSLRAALSSSAQEKKLLE